MEFLVIAPPVCTPAEPPSGAFMLAAGLAGHGFDTGLLDLSLEFYHRILEEPGSKGFLPGAGLDYILNANGGYQPQPHRTAAGSIHRHLKGFGKRAPGWRLSLMDIHPPWRVHDPLALADGLASGDDPFAEVMEESLVPVLREHRPARVIVSVAYLSQLAGAISVSRYLSSMNVAHTVGGSLPRSLEATGEGIELLRRVLPGIQTDDGSALAGLVEEGEILHRLAWPQIVSEKPYLSVRPVIPLTLSTGCFWRRCLFCPDRHMPFRGVPTGALDRFIDTVPVQVMDRRPVVHLLDSAMPPGQLARFSEISGRRGLGFYGFARPSEELARGGLLEKLAGGGCLMLQLGVESGSRGLLDRFDKGLDPRESRRIIEEAARLGIRTYIYLLFGLPGETHEDRLATADLIQGSAGSVDFLNLSLFNLPTNTELADRAGEFGITMGDYPGEGEVIRLYRPFSCAGVSPREEARKFIDEDFLVRDAIRPIHLRTPRWFRAAHLAMMDVEGRRSISV